MRLIAPAAAFALLATAACSTQIEPTNPYDPATPADRQAAASVRGTLETPTLGSPGGLTIALRANHQLVKQVQTAGDGAFLLDSVAPGSYTVDAAPVGFIPVTIAVTLAAGQDLDLGTVTLAPLLGADAATLSGRVTLEGQAAHGGILVEVVGRAFTTLTDSTGAFQLQVPEGTYELRMSHASYVAATLPDVVVARGETRVLGAVVLLGNPATVSGQVEAELAAGGWAPLADAVVTLDGTSVTGFSSSGGAFSLTGAQAGSYVLRVLKDGYDAATYPVLNLAGGELRELEEPIRLSLSRGRLDGRVALADATDAGGSIVEVTGTGRAAVTASDGSFSFDGLLSGTYEVTVRRDGYGGQVRAGLVVPAGGSVSVPTITLARQSGTVAIDEAPYVATRTVTLRLTAAGALSYKASEDPAFASAALGDVDWQPYGGAGSTRSFTLSDADGEHAVHVVYFDGTSPSSTASATVVLDRKAPSLPAVSVNTGGAYASDVAVTLTLAAQDLPAAAGQAVSGVSQMHLSNRDDFAGAWTGAYNVTSPWSLTPGDEVKKVWVRFVDRAGNVSASASATVTLDTTPPTGTISLAGTGGFAGKTGSPIVTATLAATDANGGAGNANLSVRLSSSLGFAGAVWQPFSSALSWVLTPGDGTKTVYAQFRDPAGNETSPPASATIELLTTAPSSGTLVLNGGAAATSNASVSCGISAVGAAEMRLFVNGAPATAWIPYATTATVNVGTTPDQATRVVAVSFRNGAGVEGGGTSTAIRYDATPPGLGGISLLGSLGNGSTSTTLSTSAIVIANLTPPPAGDAVEMALAQAATGASPCSGAFATPAWQPLARTATVPLTGSDGDKRVCVLFRDAAGNFLPANAAPANVLVDTTPPTNPSFSDLSATVTNAATISGHIVQASVDPAPISGAVTYECYAGPDQAYWATCTPADDGGELEFTFPLAVNAPNVVGVRARDPAYNVSAGTLVAVTQDQEAPFPPRIVNVRTGRDSLTITWEPSGDPDLDTFLLYYGSAAGDYSGTGAAEGASPVAVAATGAAMQSFTFTNLAQGATHYLSIQAVDKAGNVSEMSGQWSGTPNRVNGRVLSAVGGALGAVVARAGGGRSFAYVVQSQGMVQLDVWADHAAPDVVGRAFLPNYAAYSPLGDLVAVDCTRPADENRPAATGHCLVPIGLTLEGGQFARKNALTSPPIVFFPLTGTAGAPVRGEVVGTLPGRPFRVTSGTVAGTTLVFAVDDTHVRAFDLSNPSFPRQVASVALAGLPLEYAFGLGLVGTKLYAYTFPGVPPEATEMPVPDLHEIEVAGAASGTMTALTRTQLLTHAGAALSFPSATVVQGGFYVLYSSGGLPYVARYQGGQAAPVDWLQVTADSAYCDQLAGVGSHLHVFCPQPWGETGRPRLYMLGSSPTLALQGTAGGFDGEEQHVHQATAAVYPSSSGTIEHVLAVGEDESDGGGFSVQRWTVSGSTPTYRNQPWREVKPANFALWDHFLVASQGTWIDVVDVSNPLAPRYTSRGSLSATAYLEVLVHGNRLYVANYTGELGTPSQYNYIDQVTLRGDGTYDTWNWASLGPPPGLPVDLVARGKWLFAARGSVGISAYDISGPSTQAPALAVTFAPPGQTVDAIDARPASDGATPYTMILYVAQHDASGSSTFQTYAFDASTNTIAALSAAQPIPFAAWEYANAVSVRGPLAAVSGAAGTFTFGVTSPRFPGSASALLHPITGPVLFQDGYLVGAGTGPHGPVFDVQTSAVSDGFLPFSGCNAEGGGDAPGSLISQDGVYYAACGSNGIDVFTPVSPDGARLLKRYDISTDWTGNAPLATDGYYSLLGGPAFGSDQARMYTASEWGNALGGLSAPSSSNALAAGRAPQHMLAWDGLTLVFTTGPGDATVEAYETAIGTAAWPLRWSHTFTGRWSLGAQPVTDGNTLWLAWDGTIEAYDLREARAGFFPPAVTATAGGSVTALAVTRGRLYAATDQGEVEVYDVSGGLLTPLGPVALQPAGIDEVLGLAVQGPYVFFTFERNLFPQYGVGVMRLGPNRDGSGATDVGAVPLDYAGSDLVVSGDVLFVAVNKFLLSLDLTPLWTRGAVPAISGSTGNLDVQDWSTARTRLIVEGPFAHTVGGTYRVFDLR